MKPTTAPDTFFTASPHWGWLIVFYFFIGGLAGGACIAAALLELSGRDADRAIVRRGYLIGLIGAALSGGLLSIDLARPLRFWHMLIQSNTGRPMFKAWSPMSVGAWGLTLFGFFALLASVAAMRDEPLGQRYLPEGLRRALGRRGVRVPLAVAVAITGFFLAGYTGVLLAVTNRPLWADSQWLGVLFLVSGVSTGVATLILLEARRSHPATLAWLQRVDRNAVALEFVLLVVFLVSLGSSARVFLGIWGVVLLLTAIGGQLWPWAMTGGHGHGARERSRAALLVLAGGLLLRVTIIFSSAAVHVAGVRPLR